MAPQTIIQNHYYGAPGPSKPPASAPREGGKKRKRSLREKTRPGCKRSKKEIEDLLKQLEKALEEVEGVAAKHRATIAELKEELKNVDAAAPSAPSAADKASSTEEKS